MIYKCRLRGSHKIAYIFSCLFLIFRSPIDKLPLYDKT